MSQQVVSGFLVSLRLAGMTQLWIHSTYKSIASNVSTNVRHPEQRGTSVIQDLPTECREVRRLSPFSSEWLADS